MREVFREAEVWVENHNSVPDSRISSEGVGGDRVQVE